MTRSSSATSAGPTFVPRSAGPPRSSARCSSTRFASKLLPLPDETLVYPAHGAGSLCGKNLSTDTVSTIGVQRQFNYALQPMTKEEFVRIVTADQPDSPAYFTYDAILNTKERPTLDEALERVLKPLALSEVIERRDRGAQMLDTRDPTEYAGAHVRGSLNIGLGGSYATWCGTLLDPARPIVIVADPGREEESATRLGRIGFDNVAGYLDGGMRALDARPDLVGRTERITAPNLAEQLGSGSAPLVLDVRAPSELEAGRIEGSLARPAQPPRGAARRDPARPGRSSSPAPPAIAPRSPSACSSAHGVQRAHRSRRGDGRVGGPRSWRPPPPDGARGRFPSSIR